MESECPNALSVGMQVSRLIHPFHLIGGSFCVHDLLLVIKQMKYDGYHLIATAYHNGSQMSQRAHFFKVGAKHPISAK